VNKRKKKIKNNKLDIEKGNDVSIAEVNELSNRNIKTIEIQRKRDSI
jgi:hypothetical protein